jgi:sec-independent protein translocase protein TatA
MGPLGWQEMVFIFILALLLFGPKKLPELGKTVGKALTEFRKASSELKATFDRELSSLEREDQSIREVTSQYDPSNYSYNYDYNYESSYHDGGASSPSSSESTATEPSTVGASATQGAESTNGTANPAAAPAQEPAATAAEPGAKPAESSSTVS